MLEAVPRTAAKQVHAVKRRMAINQEIAIRRIFVLADAELSERAPSQSREAPFSERAQLGRAVFAHAPVANVGIEIHAVRVARDFEAAAFEIREAVIEIAAVEIRPAGKARGFE